MTEGEWSCCSEPSAMLNFLPASNPGSQRKFRLFAVACCRRIWPLLTLKASQNMVEVAERYAEGLVTIQELDYAHKGLSKECSFQTWSKAVNPVMAAVWATRTPDAYYPDEPALTKASLQAFAKETANYARMAAASKCNTSPDQGSTMSLMTFWREGRYQASLLRDLFGPFRTVVVEESWLRWNDRCVVKMAQAIYEERRFEDLPILADALEDAGCDNEEMLTHCREPGQHVRGCWVVDLLLGKS